MRVIQKLTAFIVVLLCAGCTENAQASPRTASPPLAVKVQIAVPKDLQVQVAYSARIAGFRTVDVHARVSGILQRKFYKEGQFVQQGDLLVQIEDHPYQIAWDKAKTSLIQTEANWQRALDLQSSGAISQQDYDSAWAEYKRAQSDVKLAEITLQYTKICAPISGVIGQEWCSEGALLQPEGSSLIAQIVQIDPVYAHFSYSSSQWLRWQQETQQSALCMPDHPRVSVQLADGTIYPHEGKIDFIDSNIDPSTASVHARAIIANSQNLLLPGQFVSLSVQDVVRSNAIAVPENVILHGPQGFFVYIVNEANTVEARAVTPGDIALNDRIINSGIKAGDRVLCDHLIKVRSGQIVQVESDDPPALCSHCGGHIIKGKG